MQTKVHKAVKIGLGLGVLAGTTLVVTKSIQARKNPRKGQSFHHNGSTFTIESITHVGGGKLEYVLSVKDFKGHLQGRLEMTHEEVMRYMEKQ